MVCLSLIFLEHEIILGVLVYFKITVLYFGPSNERVHERCHNNQLIQCTTSGYVCDAIGQTLTRILESLEKSAINAQSLRN